MTYLMMARIHDGPNHDEQISMHGRKLLMLVTPTLILILTLMGDGRPQYVLNAMAFNGRRWSASIRFQ